MKLSTIKYAVLIGILSSLVMGTSTVFAADPVANPSMAISEVHGFQHLIEENDMMILVRYEMPKTEWRIDQADVNAETSTEPFVAYMEEADCFENNENNLMDLCYRSLLSGIATQTFYDGDPDGSGSLKANRTLPRVGQGLSGLYLGTGHGLTFGDTSYESCVEGSATVFSPRTVLCQSVLWHSVATTTANPGIMAAAREQNAPVLVSIAENLESEAAGKFGAFVVNRRITPMGAIMFIEAYTNIQRGAPDAFAANEEDKADVRLSGDKTAAQIEIDTQAQNSKFYNYVADFADGRLKGTNVNLVGGVIIIIIGMVVLAVVLSIIKSLMAAVIMAALTVFGFGVLNGLFDMTLFMIVLLIVFALGAFAYVRTKIS